MGRALNKEEWLRLAKEFQEKVHKTKPSITIDLEGYRGTKNKVKYYCSKHDYHGELTGAAVLKSLGCPSCSKENHQYNKQEYKTSRSKKELANFILKASELHGDKYEYFDDYKNSRTKINIRCRHHDTIFTQRPSAHLQGQGCPECGKEAGIINLGIGEEAFHKRWLAANTNPKISYVAGSFTIFHSTVQFQCVEHGLLTLNSSNILKPSVCVKCNLEVSRKILQDKFIEKSKRLYPNQFDYSLVNYINNRKKIKLICVDHGIVEVSPMHHLSELGHGSGCLECSRLLWGRWSPKVLMKNEDYFRSEKCFLYLAEVDGIYKLGITTNIKRRFAQIKTDCGLLPKLLLSYESNTFQSSQMEHHLAAIFKSKRYDHPLKFGGYTECYYFTEEDLVFLNSFFTEADF